MKKTEKGCYGYAVMKRNRFILLSILFFLLMVIPFITGLLLFNTRFNILSVLACLMSLPFAKMFIGLLVTAKFQPMNKEEYQHISSSAGEAGKYIYYDIPINDTERHYFMQAVYINENKVICFIKDSKGRIQCKRIIEDSLKDNSVVIKTVADASDFTELVSAAFEKSSEDNRQTGDIDIADDDQTNDDGQTNDYSQIKDKIFSMGV